MSVSGAFAVRLEALAVAGVRLSGVQYFGLNEADGVALALEHGLPLREVQALALEQGVVPERYVRNFEALDWARQAKLLRSRALLVGLGGLGGHVLDIVCRMGVGSVVAADGDCFEQSNLNRQLLAQARTLLRPKAEAARERVRAVNPAVELEALAEFVDEVAMQRLAAGAGVVVDALGGLDDRPALARVAAQAGVPLVTAAIAGMSGYVATVLPGARGPADLLGTGAGAEDALGSPAPAVAVAASLQAAEALCVLCGDPPALAGKMLVFDLRDMTFETMTLGD